MRVWLCVCGGIERERGREIQREGKRQRGEKEDGDKKERKDNRKKVHTGVSTD